MTVREVMCCMVSSCAAHENPTPTKRHPEPAPILLKEARDLGSSYGNYIRGNFNLRTLFDALSGLYT